MKTALRLAAAFGALLLGTGAPARAQNDSVLAVSTGENAALRGRVQELLARQAAPAPVQP
jgi:hypothetical protein